MKIIEGINKYYIIWSIVFTCIFLPIYLINIDFIQFFKLDLIYFILFKMDPADSQSLYPNYYPYIDVVVKISPFVYSILSILTIILIIKRYKKAYHIFKELIIKYSYFSLDIKKHSLLKTLTAAASVSLIISLIFYYLTPYFQHLSPDDINRIQLYISQLFIVVLFSIILLLIIFNQDRIYEQIKHFLFQKKSPYELAFFRILFFSYVGLSNFGFFLKNTFWFDSTDKVSLPYMGWFIHAFDLSTPQYEFICILGIICSFAVALGLFTRWMLILHTILIFLVIATPNFYGKLSHNQIYIWMSWIFTFSKCYDVWSIDALWKKYKKKPIDISPKSDYGIPIKMLWFHFCIIYFFAGVYKLWNAGFDWALSDSMINQILVEWIQHYDWKPALRIDHYPNLVKFGGLITILLELAFPFIIFKFRHRLVAIIGGLSLHKNAGYFMKIAFMNLQILYISFINMDWIFHKYFLLKRKFKTILSKKEIIEGEKEIYFKGILSNKNQTSKPVYGNAVLWVGIGLLSLNSFCGLFAIHSYPFSAYPSYSDLVPNEIEILHFEGYDSQGTEIDVLEEAEMISFRRENFTIFENNIIADVKKEISVEDQILKYWKIWYLNVPALQEITHLKVYYHKTPVLPDKRKELIINELIFDGPAKQE